MPEGIEYPQNMGSFGAPAGGAEALKNALRRRGIDTSVLNQMSAGAAGGPAPVPGQVPQGAPNVAPSIDQSLQPVSPGETKPQARSAEQEIALKALADTVKTENKIAEALIGMR